MDDYVAVAEVEELLTFSLSLVLSLLGYTPRYERTLTGWIHLLCYVLVQLVPSKKSCTVKAVKSPHILQQYTAKPDASQVKDNNVAMSKGRLDPLIVQMCK